MAGSPEQSLVIQFITAALKPSMPLGQPPLTATDVSIIRDWINSGAKDDSPSEVASSEPAVYHQPPVITALRFSPDGQTLAVSGNREVLLHHADGSGLVKRLPGRADRILSIAFSADGNLMIAGGGTPARFGEIQFWAPREGRLLRTAEVTGDTVFGASLSPDASKVAVGCADNTVRAFESATGKELYKISAHENWVLGTAFGMDSKRLVSVGRDRAAKLIDAEAGQFLENVNQMHGELAAVARHPKADEIVIGGEDRIPYVYRMDRPRNMKVGENATLMRQLRRTRRRDLRTGLVARWQARGSRRRRSEREYLRRRQRVAARFVHRTHRRYLCRGIFPRQHARGHRRIRRSGPLVSRCTVERLHVGEAASCPYRSVGGAQ